LSNIHNRHSKKAGTWRRIGVEVPAFVLLDAPGSAWAITRGGGGSRVKERGKGEGEGGDDGKERAKGAMARVKGAMARVKGAMARVKGAMAR
jgi:hypothetical protein